MKRTLILLSLCALVLVALAHEYVLLAHQYRLKKGDDLEVHLLVADGFNVQEERAYQKTRTLGFGLMTKEGRTDLSTTADGALPLINRKVDFDGGGLIRVERDYARLALPTAKFLVYLKEDHIEGIAEKLDRKKKEQKERYTRYLKCLVQSGGVYTDTLYKAVLGQNFEIVLLQNPYRLNRGSTLRAKILFQGRPLANKTITARSRTGSEAPTVQTARTNAQGVCAFAVRQRGEWFIHATHMVECPDKSDSDWESFWASYSFGIGG